MRAILQAPDPRLRLKSEAVTDFQAARALALEMRRFLRGPDGEMRGWGLAAWGLAAPQLGELRRIVVVWPAIPEPLVLVNPEIVERRGVVGISQEGCLSVSEGIDRFTVKGRAKKVGIRAQTVDGEPFATNATGQTAICVQHEVDHLDGVLIVPPGWVPRHWPG